MTIEIRVPQLGESVSEATVGQWFKKPGEPVEVDEPIVELETDKVTVEVPAPSDGTLNEIVVGQGETVAIGAVLGSLNEGEAPKAQKPKTAKPEPAKTQDAKPTPPPPAATRQKLHAGNGNSAPERPPSPAARKALAEAGLSAHDVKGSGRHGQVLKEDVIAAASTASQSTTALSLRKTPSPLPVEGLRLPGAQIDVNREERVKMTRLRQTIAQRLKDAQDTAAILTTFNDVDMTAIMAMRKQYKELFERRHEVKLGFMAFFVKACIQALKEIPAVNAEVDGDEIVYKNYYHVGVAVGTDKGLVVPVIRDADQLSLAEIELQIADYGRRARDGRLNIEEMQGGTFTISNGGVYGSMLSTPILNAPQSGILGMHRIEERPVAINGEVAVRPMMYLALSYDHRIVDGKEAVTFLVRVKECLEDPQRFVLDL